MTPTADIHSNIFLFPASNFSEFLFGNVRAAGLNRFKFGNNQTVLSCSNPIYSKSECNVWEYSSDSSLEGN